jgi:hypothetical protein
MVKEIMAADNNHINKEDFVYLYPPTCKEVFTHKNISSGFIGVGLKPLDKY